MKYFLSLVLINSISLAYSQTQGKAYDYFVSKPAIDSVAYTRDYPLKEGVYLKIKNFKQNSPLTKDQIIIDYPKDQVDFWSQVIMKKKFSYRDSSGIIKKININEIWGYSVNKQLYINTSPDGFKKCIIIGSLCYLDKRQDLLDNVPIMNPERIEMKATPIIKIPEKIDVFDMETNASEELDSGDMKLILAREPELLKEYSALSYKRRKQTMMLYLRKYNEKHPLYLPAK